MVLTRNSSKVVSFYKTCGYFPNKRFDRDELLRCLRENQLTPDRYNFDPIGPWTTCLTIRSSDEAGAIIQAFWMKKANISKVKITHQTNKYEEYYYELDPEVEPTVEEEDEEDDETEADDEGEDDAD